MPRLRAGRQEGRLATPMSAVAAVHEEVHERARQKQQKRQREEQMGPVLGEEEVQRNRTQDKQADGIA